MQYIKDCWLATGPWQGCPLRGWDGVRLKKTLVAFLRLTGGIILLHLNINLISKIIIYIHTGISHNKKIMTDNTSIKIYQT